MHKSDIEFKKKKKRAKVWKGFSIITKWKCYVIRKGDIISNIQPGGRDHWQPRDMYVYQSGQEEAKGSYGSSDGPEDKGTKNSQQVVTGKWGRPISKWLKLVGKHRKLIPEMPVGTTQGRGLWLEQGVCTGSKILIEVVGR